MWVSVPSIEASAVIPVNPLPSPIKLPVIPQLAVTWPESVIISVHAFPKVVSPTTVKSFIPEIFELLSPTIFPLRSISPSTLKSSFITTSSLIVRSDAIIASLELIIQLAVTFPTNSIISLQWFPKIVSPWQNKLLLAVIPADPNIVLNVAWPDIP